MGAPEQGSSNCRRAVFTGQRAMAAAEGLIEAAEATRNPTYFLSRCSSTASRTATLIQSARVMPCAGAW